MKTSVQIKYKLNSLRLNWLIQLVGLLLFMQFSTLSKADTLKLKGPYALVAGGSKGIGYSIAEALAKRHYNLILIARHEDALQQAKSKLETLYAVHVEIIVKDLSDEKTSGEIAEWCKLHQIHLNVLCNVAGFGGANDYLSIPMDSVRYMIHLNVESAMTLSMALLPLLEQNSPSYILNVASMAGFAPIPIKNVYAATKAALISFSYSLRYQLKEKNISVSCLCPGPVFTKPSIEKDTKEKLGWLGVQMAVPVKKVGEIAIRKMLRKRMIIIPGTISKISSVPIRFFPQRWMASLFHRISN